MRLEIILRRAPAQLLPLVRRDAIQRTNPRLTALQFRFGRAPAFVFPVGGDDTVLGADFRFALLQLLRGGMSRRRKSRGAAADDLAIGFFDADIARWSDAVASLVNCAGADIGVGAPREVAQLCRTDGAVATVGARRAFELPFAVALLADFGVGASGEIARGGSADGPWPAVDAGGTGDLALLFTVLADFCIGTAFEVAGVNGADWAMSTWNARRASQLSFLVALLTDLGIGTPFKIAGFNGADGAVATLKAWGAGYLAIGQRGRERRC
ncbi:MAG: hypothetical protein Q9191_008185 [Dirinaria sp. TL-2023a]